MIEILGEYRTAHRIIFAERVDDADGMGRYRLKQYTYSYFQSKEALKKAFNEKVPDRCKIK